MRLKSLRLSNFLSFGERPQELNFGSFNTIVGSNNSGKTNVLRAVSLVGQALRERQVERRPYHHQGDIDTPAEVEIGIILDSAELVAVSDFLTCSSLSRDVSVGSKERKERLESLRDELITRFYRPGFSKLFQNTAIRLKFSSEDRYGEELCLVLRHQDAEFFVPELNMFSPSPRRPSSASSKIFGQIALEELRSRDSDRFDAYVQGESDSPPTAEISPLTFELLADTLKAENRTVLEISSHQFIDLQSKMKDKAPFISLRKFLLEHGFTGDFVGLRELFSSIYNSAIIRLSDMRSKPQSIQELTSPELATSKFSLMTGEELPEMLFALKNSVEPGHVRRYRKIAETFKTLTGGQSFDIAVRTKETEIEQGAQVIEEEKDEYAEWNSPYRTRPLALRHKKTTQPIYGAQIQIFQDGFPVPIDFAAAGITETLLLLTAIVGHASKILLLDEPALNLHPSMQRKIMDELGISMEQNGNQVVLVTHSPYFISVDRLENAWRLVMGRNGTEIINIGETVQALRGEDKQKLVMRLANPDVRALMFARGVVFAEGPSEKLVIELTDKALKSKKERVALDEREWNVLSLGSKSNLAAFMVLARKLRVNFAAVLDNDALHEIFAALTKCDLLDEKGLKVNERSTSELREMAQKYGIFVFKEDLERAMGIEVSHKESKPLKAMQAILKKIDEGNIPPEILELMEHLDQHVSGYN